jgi:hypothetical protein
MIHRLRESIGSKLLAWAMAILPRDTCYFIGGRRGIEEQREYERYEGLTLLFGGQVLPFDRWREQWRWLTREVHHKLPQWRQTDMVADESLGQVVRFRRRGQRVLPMRKAAR